MDELVLELLSEEMPASIIDKISFDVKNTVCKSLKKNNFTFSNYSSIYSPRRITFVIEGLKLDKSILNKQIKGPRTDAPSIAVEGFLRSNNLSKKDLEIKKIDKGEFFFANLTSSSSNELELLKNTLKESLQKIPWDKSMVWGSEKLRWIRPLKSIMCIYKSKLLEFNIGKINSVDYTYGHRVHFPKKIKILSFKQYTNDLLKHSVMVDHLSRESKIIEEVINLLKNKKLSFVPDKKLLKEVVGLVEWPNVLLGSFDSSYLKLPKEVLISSMEIKQKYFPLKKSNKIDISNNFIIVSNIKAEDNGKQVIKGNERVLNARLADAKFFWDLDCKETIENKFLKLKGLVFHAKLGTVYLKVLRMQKIGKLLSSLFNLQEDEVLDLDRAIRLCKTDLVSSMVIEFPDLQGVMGYHYSNLSGENTNVSMSILEQYKPTGPKDSLPEKNISKILSLIEKIDTLVGFFSIDELPSSSKDPYALRRSTIGMIRILLEGDYQVNLKELFYASLKIYADSLPDENKFKNNSDLIVENLSNFVSERLVFFLKDVVGLNVNVLNAIDLQSDNLNVINNVKKARFLDQYLKTKRGESLIQIYRRIANILNTEERKFGKFYSSSFSEKLAKKNEEIELLKSLENIKFEKDHNYESFLESIVDIKEPLDVFFDNLKINDENNEIRLNRLKILSHVRKVFAGVADMSKIIKGA